MTQRSITSFFLPKAKKPEESDIKRPSTPKKEAAKDGNLSDEPDGDSPIKPQRKSRLYIESDSEEESPAATSPATSGTGRASTAQGKGSGSEKPAAATPGSSSVEVPSPPLRKTARKTTGGKKYLENKQKKRLEELKSSVERDVQDGTEANSTKSAAEDADDVTEKKTEMESPKYDTKENVQPDDSDSLTHIGEKPVETSEKADLVSKETGSSKSPSTKTSSKTKAVKAKQKASPAAGKAKTGRKRASSGDPNQKRAKKKSLTSSDETAQQTEGMDTGEGESVEKEKGEVDMKTEEEEVKTKEEKATKKKPSESASPSASRVGTGIFGLQRKQNSGTGDAEENAYDPGKKRYHPVNDAVWKLDQGVPFLALARTFDLIEGTSARLKKVDALANYFRSVITLSPSDLLPSVYLCLNKLAPAYEGIELGIGEQAITKAIAGATGRTADKIKIDAAEKGDLALVAEASKSRQKLMFRPAPLTVAGVFRALRDIARLSGHAVQQQKVSKMQGLLVACRHSETRFVVRALSGKLRIGLAEQSALQALSQACAQTPPEQPRPAEVLDALVDLPSEKASARCDQTALVLKTTYCECPSYDEIVPVLLEHGIDALPEHCKIRPGVPLKPMLAHPTRGVSEVLTRFENAAFTCEYKYDGERAQIHLLEDGAVRIYSRNQEDNTSKYPDIIARFPACIGEDVKSCILDSEAVAWDTEKRTILPFQVLSTRKRKDAVAEDIKVKVCVFAFDLLMLNGESLVKEPFETRREKLRSAFKEVEGEFVFAKSNDSTNVEEIAEFLDESIKGNCEGLMVKTLQKDATYEIAKRSRNWLKLKKDYLDGVGDTIDVVVIGGFLGKGKRAGRYGGFLLACYDTENEEFQSVCKIGTGFSDEDLQTHSSYFGQHRIDAPKPYYRYAIEPDHWFDACQVWEIKCADLSISPVHKAAVGIVDPERGISLRFPRFLRVRDDKEPEAATSAQQVASMYRNQDQVKNQAAEGGTSKAEEEDFY